MNKIESLIEEYCPTGLEYKKLGNIVEIYRGKRLTKSQLSHKEKFPVYHGGLDPLGYYGYSNRVANSVMIINVGASAGTVGFSAVDFWSSDGCFCLGHSELFISRYIYYALLCHENTLKSKVRVAGIPTLDASAIENLNIPLPPLPVQEEIVNILDKFTSLEAELEAELEARKTQYDYYRNQLLGFVGKEVEWKTLGEIGKVCMCKRVMKNETTFTGDIPFYKIGTFGGDPDAYISEKLFEDHRKHYSFPKKGDILISAAGTIGRTVIYDGKPAYFQDSNIVWIDNQENIVLNKYLFHYYKIVKWKTDGGTISRLYNDNLSKAKIPIPPLSEQERIVEILDKFDALVNDISEGLPSEIQARRKQYEYYRNKLLTFKPLVN